MEPLIVLVGFLGAGKTTLLKYLIDRYVEANWRPFVILNDYENAYLDATQLESRVSADSIASLHGSCICCSGITELRDAVNRIPLRDRGVTLIEANGTSDACSLMGFLGVGLEKRFLPPVQISVIDVKNWQLRDTSDSSTNELEANQIQLSSLIILNHLESVSTERIAHVKRDVRTFNPHAQILSKEELNISALGSLKPSKSDYDELDHKKAHWASCSIDLPILKNCSSIKKICDAIPSSILRVKGCTIIESEGVEKYTFFERVPDGEVYVKPYNGTPVTGPKLLVIGPGSSLQMLEKAVEHGLRDA